MSLIDRTRRLLGHRPSPLRRPAAENQELPVISPEQTRAAHKDGATIVDVREDDEWAAGHVAGARHLSVGAIASNPDVDVPANTPIVTYCMSGARAERAAEILRAADYFDVRAMRGGYDDWKDAGYPVETPLENSRD